MYVGMGSSGHLFVGDDIKNARTSSCVSSLKQCNVEVGTGPKPNTGRGNEAVLFRISATFSEKKVASESAVRRLPEDDREAEAIFMSVAIECHNLRGKLE